MAKIKLTKSAVDAAQSQAQAVELRDTLVPGFLCKITPAGRKVFMLQYRTNAGERRKPALGLYGELTVEQACTLAQEWLALVRRGGDPAADKAAARKVPTVKELCEKFMEDHSKQRNKPSTQAGYQKCIRNNIIPMLGRMKVQDVKRAELAAPQNRQDGNRIVIAGRDSAQDSINQVGQEMTRRNMNIQPTLTERPGLPVRIIVNRDLVLRPYQPLFFNRGAM